MKALAALVAGLAVLAAGCGGGEDVPALPAGKFIAATRSVTPKVTLFAEPVVARVDVLVDSEKYDPDLLSVSADFDPYEREGDPVRTRRDQGRYTHLRFEFTIRCLVYECIQEIGGGPSQVQPGGIPPPLTGSGGFGERKTIQLKNARLLYEDPDKGTQRVRNISWPVVQSVSRLNFGDTNVTGIGFPFESSVTPLPKATYRVSPNLLAAGLIVGALVLLAFPAVLAVRTFRKEPPPVEEPEPEIPPLEKALLLVEWAREREEQERREALEALAEELDVAEKPDLASETRRLAWSRSAPTPEAMGDLVQSVRDSEEEAGEEEPDAAAA